MKQSGFVEKFGSIFEHSPWVAEDAYSRTQGISDPAIDVSKSGDVHDVMVRAFRDASKEARMKVLLAHPDLAGKLAQAKQLTEASTSEQASAGLDMLTDDEREMFTRQNNAYVEKFGFPFIIAVKDNTKASIIAAFEARLVNTKDQEFEEACKQVERIAYHRLADMLD
jgi:OHCU decarboxylase